MFPRGKTPHRKTYLTSTLNQNNSPGRKGSRGEGHAGALRREGEPRRAAPGAELEDRAAPPEAPGLRRGPLSASSTSFLGFLFAGKS